MRIHMERPDQQQLLRLSGLLRPALGLPHHADAAAEPVGSDLVKFAIRRHRVGPLLFAATDKAANAEPAARDTLQKNFIVNQTRGLAKQAATGQLVQIFEAERLPIILMKGATLASQLYEKPPLRQAKDVDALVDPAHAQRAIALMHQHGYAHKSGNGSRSRGQNQAKQLQLMDINKDVTFADPVHGVLIELHQRLLWIEPAGFTAQFLTSFEGGQTSAMQSPSIQSASYALYLIIHGATTNWQRLKWLCDLTLLLRKMERQTSEEMFILARQFDCASAVIASCTLAEEIFPGTLDAQWADVISKAAPCARYERLLALFRNKLMSSDASGAEPVSGGRVLHNPAKAIFGAQVPNLAAFRARLARTYADWI